MGGNADGWHRPTGWWTYFASRHDTLGDVKSLKVDPSYCTATRSVVTDLPRGGARTGLEGTHSIRLASGISTLRRPAREAGFLWVLTRAAEQSPAKGLTGWLQSRASAGSTAIALRASVRTGSGTARVPSKRRRRALQHAATSGPRLPAKVSADRALSTGPDHPCRQCFLHARTPAAPPR